MHITLESDYAVRIVYCLAQNGGRMEAAAIAEQTGVTLRFSLKILRKLVAGELVKSYKGAGGGYELAKDPKEISLYEVIEQVEGPYATNAQYTIKQQPRMATTGRMYRIRGLLPLEWAMTEINMGI